MPKSESKAKTDERRLVRFRLADKEYAVDIGMIVEIIYYRPAVPLPQSPAFIEGVVDLRGTVIPVLDLKKRLRLPSAGSEQSHHILIVRLQDKMIGMVVDEVEQVIQVEEAQIQSSQRFLEGAGSRHLQGICKLNDQLIFVLSLDTLLSGDEQAQLEEI